MTNEEKREVALLINEATGLVSCKERDWPGRHCGDTDLELRLFWAKYDPITHDLQRRIKELTGIFCPLN